MYTPHNIYVRTVFFKKVLPYKIQRLVFIPSSPRCPAFIKQMPVVFRPMGPYGLITSETTLKYTWLM